MGPVLALTSALFYGISDFTGGLLSRRAHFVQVAAVGQAGGLLFTVVAATVVGSPGVPASIDLAWGALSGIGTGVGMLFLFRGLSRGAMSVVVPISAVCGIAVPVLIGVAALGERPSTLSWLGIVIAVPALWLVAHTGTHAGPALPAAAVDGLIAGIGIAVQYISLSQAGAESGLWPVAAGRVAAILTIVPLLPTAGGARIRRSRHTVPAAAATGAAAALALIAYLLATREQIAVVAVALSSLYPVVPVLLGVTVLRERLIPKQAAGLLAAASAVALLATS
ncbi:EamA family transporter [Rhodococcus sp. NPDC057529]|uniref:EamA family transporter n=1 Tax=Rhodococcus sp. NPDC057529 TaxID=3346158 RepID=UPI00366F4073